MLNPYANHKNAVFDGDKLRTMPTLCSYQSHIQWDAELQSEDELNQYGYRSSEFTGQRNLAIGCSWTYGSFLKYEQTWPYLWEEAWNLAAPGASNDYVSRTLLSAVELKPKRVVVLFPRTQRREHFDYLFQYFYNNYYRWRDHEPILKEVLAHHDALNSEESNYINFYKNYKLVELLMKDKQIDWRYAIVPPEGSKNKLCIVKHRDDYDFLDESRRLEFDVVDYAKDGKHPGVQSHKLFAERVRSSFVSLPEQT